ncbi:profilin [Streptomyces sp. NPDC052415]|uniref:profilin n=1 Tax=Streptomyces sp. NPDC052415 TaxID=3365690 RepID=UPI0037D310ED
MESYQELVGNLAGSGKVSRAAIVGLEGGVWAASPGFDLSGDYVKAIVEGIDDPDAVLTSSGFRLKGQKYVVISAHSGGVEGKNKADGAVLVKTKRAVVVAEYVAPVQAHEAKGVADGVANAISSQGF